MPFIEYKSIQLEDIERVRTAVRNVCNSLGLKAVDINSTDKQGEIYDVYAGESTSVTEHVSFHANPEELRTPSLWAKKEVIKQVHELLPRKISFGSVVNRK